MFRQYKVLINSFFARTRVSGKHSFQRSVHNISLPKSKIMEAVNAMKKLGYAFNTGNL